jgi:hypothetical protein
MKITILSSFALVLLSLAEAALLPVSTVLVSAKPPALSIPREVKEPLDGQKLDDSKFVKRGENEELDGEELDKDELEKREGIEDVEGEDLEESELEKRGLIIGLVVRKRNKKACRKAGGKWIKKGLRRRCQTPK